MYIVYRKYNASPLRSELFQNVSLQSFTLEEGTLLDESKLFIFYNKDPIAKKDDLSIYEYLVNNDDNQGLEKGKYIYATAFAKRKRIHSNGSVNRFSENEIEVLTKFWNNYFDGKNFTLKYFNADLTTLQQIAQAVNIKFKGIERAELPVKGSDLDEDQVLLHSPLNEIKSEQSTGLLAALIGTLNEKSSKISNNAKKLAQIKKHDLLKKEVFKQNMHEVNMKKIKSVRVANELTEEDRKDILLHSSKKHVNEVEGTKDIDITQVKMI